MARTSTALTQFTAEIENPFWLEVRETVQNTSDFMRGWELREPCVRKYAWAISDPETVLTVASWLGPYAVEMGAGNGYWAWLLAQLGVDVVAYDIAPPQLHTQNHFFSPRDKETKEYLNEFAETYYPVRMGDPSTLTDHPDRSLFLCWPPYNDDMALECLQAYTGNRLVYIGESYGGCNGTDAFFTQLEEEWDEIDSHGIVQWYGINDYVTLYERKG